MKEPTGKAHYDRETGILTITVDAKRGKRAVQLQTRYLVENLNPDPEVAFPAFSLTKGKSCKTGEWEPQGDVWHIAVETFGPTCSCPHATFRGANTQSVCKHVLGARAVGLLPK